MSILHFVSQPSDDQLQREWDHLENWSRASMLPINFLKCNVLDIVTKNNFCLSPVCLSDGGVLDIVRSNKFLGVIFTHDMKWDLHFQGILKKACKRLYILISLRRAGCPSDIMFHVYSSLIRSLSLYSCPVWCNAPEYLRKKLSIFERRVLRIIGSDAKYPKLFDVADNICENLMRSITLFDNHPSREMFQSRSETRTRNKQRLVTFLAKTARFSKSFIKFCENVS